MAAGNGGGSVAVGAHPDHRDHRVPGHGGGEVRPASHKYAKKHATADGPPRAQLSIHPGPGRDLQDGTVFADPGFAAHTRRLGRSDRTEDADHEEGDDELRVAGVSLSPSVRRGRGLRLHPPAGTADRGAGPPCR
jgi:hypothetical protein